MKFFLRYSFSISVLWVINVQAKVNISHHSKRDSLVPVYHKIQKAENLFRISLRYNVTLAHLQEWNHIKNPDALVAGDTLIVRRQWVHPASVKKHVTKQVFVDSAGTPKNDIVLAPIKHSVTNDFSNKSETKQGTFLKRLWHFVQSSSIAIKSIYFFILICFIITVAALFFIFIKRAISISHKRVTDILRKQYEGLLSNYLFENTSDLSVAFELFKTNLKKKYLSNSILLEEIIKIHKVFSGEYADKLSYLYFDLGFDKYSRNKLNDRKWYIKIMGMRELAQFGVSDARAQIGKYINHPHPILSAEAQIAHIRLSADNDLSFLDTLESPLTDWSQAHILATIHEGLNKPVPEFSRWLASKNQSVVLFAIRMIGKLKQLQAVEKMLGVLHHSNAAIRGAAIEVLGSLEVNVAKSTLLDIYPKEELSCKVKVLDALASIGIEEDIAFLRGELLQKEYEIKLAASGAIKKISVAGNKTLLEIYEHADDELQRIIAHTLDERIL